MAPATSRPPQCKRHSLIAGTADIVREHIKVLPQHRRSPAEGVAVPAPRHRQVQAALGRGVCLGGQGEPLRREVPHDRGEPGALGADQVRGRHPDVGEGQLGGVLRVQADLLEAFAAAEAGTVARSVIVMS